MPSIFCDHCHEEITHVEIIKEEYGVMDIGKPASYREDDYDMHYFCPKCDLEIEELTLIEKGVLGGE